MAITKLAIGILVLSMQANFASADAASDATTAEALSKTQNLLHDRMAREKAAGESTKAAATMKSAESFVGKENTQELYDLSAEIMGTVTNQSNGNVKLMSESLQKSPEDFIKFLNPEEIAKIKALAKKIEAQRSPSSSTPR